MKTPLNAPLARCGVASLIASFAAFASLANAPDPATLQKLSRATVPFVVNAGQWDSRAAFAAQTFAGTVFVTKKGELIYSLPGKPIPDDASAADVVRP